MPDEVRYVSEDRVMRLLAEFARELERRFAELATRADLHAVAATVLTQDAIKEMIADGLSQSDARGWTHKERFITILLCCVTCFSLIVGIIGLILRITGKGG